jgi:monoterpene epsilon-lactone hydrolase
VIPRVHFEGPLQYRLRSAATVSEAVLESYSRRLAKGPRLPGWNLFMEVATGVFKAQLKVAFELREASVARSYLDSFVVGSPAPGVSITPVSQPNFRGSWFTSTGTPSRVTLFYLHGGGFSFYPKAYARLIAQITLAAQSKTFALDYRLSPQHKFPAQLEDALNAYRWLLENGATPETLVIGGDSAGANIALGLLLAAREADLPLPALAIALSPPTDLDPDPSGILRNEPFDWVQGKMLEQWANWFCDRAQRHDPLISPIHADLSGLPPIYIQAGRCEILFDSIQAFADRAKNQGANVVLESWEDMNHVFQLFAPAVPQSVHALGRIREVIDSNIRSAESRAACAGSAQAYGISE